MKKFMDENFMLNSKSAEILYHDYAEKMPIYDFHCHLSPKEIAENKSYKNITEVWLGGDHYKWRAMRSNGVDEKYITGDADDKDKFKKWCETVENCIGNPLYHWAHLELKRYFNLDDIINSKNAELLWDKCNELLTKPEFRARNLITRSNVKQLCTTDDPTDDLQYHKQIAEDKDFNVKVVPTFRPDKAIYIEREIFVDWLKKLEEVSQIKINGLEDLFEALGQRINHFDNNGCCGSDHALEPPVFEAGTDEEVDKILKKAINGENLTLKEINQYKTKVLIFLGKQYSRLGWVMQYHIGCIRNNNSRMMKILGPDTGYDAIADYNYAGSLAKLLDELDKNNELPKTILYSLNPRDNELLASMIGCFQDGKIPGKLQFGSAWWFNDHKDGMVKQMQALANIGLLSKFVGMLTDSRSFLSYTRHEYFRRILCDMIGEWVEIGELPNDYEMLGKMVENISYNNAKKYFG